MVSRHDRLIYSPIIFSVIIIFIVATKLLLLVTCRAQVGSSGGIFIGHPEDSFNINFQRPPAAAHSSELPASVPNTHQLFQSVVSFAC
jgi:hypothetical protein